MNGTKPLTIKYHSLTGRITLPLMYLAFRNVRKNRGAAGVDRQSIAMFERQLDQNLVALMKHMKSGDFEPLPSRRTYVEKIGSSKKRPLGIPCVRDRVAQEVLRQLLSPLFEKLFHPHSYGFRPKRSCHDALRKVDEWHHDGFRFVLDADIKGFFDNIPKDVMMAGLRNVIADGNVLTLAKRFLDAGVMEDGVHYPSTVGTPQGGVLSPLLANIALNVLDWQLEEAGYRFVRYADDFVVLCRSRDRAEEARDFVEQRISEIGLQLSPEKTKVVRFMDGFAFLGFDFTHKARRMRTKSVEKYKDRMRELTKRSHNLDSKVVEKINSVVRGVARYFGTEFATVTKQFEKLDIWLRTRLRSMKFKRKSKNDNFRLKNKHLRRLGLTWLSDFLPAPEG